MRRRKDTYRPLDITTIEELRAAMTDTQDSRRPDGDIGLDKPFDGTVRVSNAKAAYTNWRTVDSIRKVALECAVELIGTVEAELRPDDDLPGLAIMWAERLELYLTGEEANGTTSPHPFVDAQRPTRLPGAQCLLITGPGRICGHSPDDPIHSEEADGPTNP